MAQTNVFLDCGDCLEVVDLPAISEEQDDTCYDQELSEVSDLIIRPDGAPDCFANFATTPTYVTDSIDNTAGDGSKCIRVVGIGQIGEPTAEDIQYPKGLVRKGDGSYTLDMVFYHLANGGYEFWLAVQCGSIKLKFYYIDLSNFVYGKQGGVQPSSVVVTFPKGTGQAKNQAHLQLTWKTKGGLHDPFRKPNPLA